ncbi:MAG: hypothetical protein WDW36_009634 [Sanguina aurantia]
MTRQRQELELTCARLGVEGKGVCLVPPSNFVVLVNKALPGEVVKAVITQLHRGYAEAVKVSTVSPHSNAVAPACPHAGPCGGCTLQGLAYAAQLSEKQNQVVQMLRRVAKLPGAGELVRPILPASRLLGYRNKLQFAFGSRVWSPDGYGRHHSALTLSTAAPAPATAAAAGQQQGLPSPPAPTPPPTPSSGPAGAQSRPAASSVLGFMRPGSGVEVLPISRCELQDDLSNRLLAAVREGCERHRLLPHDDPGGQGLMRHLIIRKGMGSAPPSLPTMPDDSSSDDSSSVSDNVSGSSSGSSSGSGSGSGSGSTHFDSSTAERHTPTASRQVPASPRPVAQYMLVLVTSRDEPGRLLPLVRELAAQFPRVVSIAHSIAAPPSSDSKSSSGRRPSTPAKKGSAHAHKAAASSPSAARSPPTGKPSTPTRSGSSGSPQGGSNGSEQAGSSSGSPGRKAAILHGSSTISDSLCGLTFSISPDSFFQTNTSQSEVLYDSVRVAAGLKPDCSDSLLDLYCGTGTIGLSLARHCRSVVGFEMNGSAVADARENATRNSITNATFIQGDLEKGGATALAQRFGRRTGPPAQRSSTPLPSPATQRTPGRQQPPTPARPVDTAPSTQTRSAQHRPTGPGNASEAPAEARQSHTAVDVVVVDPARAGLSAAVVQFLRSGCGARRLVYVSCNVATMARDLALLCGAERVAGGAVGTGSRAAQGVLRSVPAGFELLWVQPVDMFPHTDHVEMVACLDRRT